MLKPKSAHDSIKETKDYNIVPFRQKRGDGDSGPLLVATKKNDTSECFIMKFFRAECAINEFIYSCIAQALNISTPEIVLFKLTETPNPYGILPTDYIMGSRKIDIGISCPTIEQILSTSNGQDYFRFVALREIFDEYDSFETPITTNNVVFRIDTSASFGNTPMGMHEIITMTRLPQCFGFAKGLLDSIDYDRPWEKRNFLSGKIRCEEEGHMEGVSVYLDTFARFIELPQVYIDSIIHTLSAIYPDIICTHYQRYIAGIQKQTELFLKNHR